MFLTSLYYNITNSLIILFVIAPPIILIIIAIINIIRIVKSVKKSEDIKHSTARYVLNLIIDILLLLTVLMRLCHDYKSDYCKYYEQHVMI